MRLHCGNADALTPPDGPTDVAARLLARNFDKEFSAISARSSASSTCCCNWRYLAKFVPAISSCGICRLGRSCVQHSSCLLQS
uniref:Uncharacterized protein n=1 Tax=Romanomermis culicivorax TaxID=13658 RepID=A0A915JA48_ROMCU